MNDYIRVCPSRNVPSYEDCYEIFYVVQKIIANDETSGLPMNLNKNDSIETYM